MAKIGMLVAGCAIAAAKPGIAAQIGVVNAPTDQIPALSAAAQAHGDNLVALAPDIGAFPGKVIVWEAANGKSDITDSRASALEAFVRAGGSLIVSYSQQPGSGPFRLSAVLPTTSWQTITAVVRGPESVVDFDSTFFGTAPPSSFALPFHFDIQPVSAIERGEDRYERFDRTIPYIAPTGAGMPVSGGNDFWTHPLINRDWVIRARADDHGQSPVLITGLYGAGRVAVFASSLVALPDSSGTRSFFTPLLAWLTSTPPAGAAFSGKLTAPTVSVDKASRTLKVTIANSSNASLPVQLVVRELTWEGAYVADSSQSLSLPGSGAASAAVTLPSPSATNYQALSYRDAFIVRIGVVGPDGSLLNEIRMPVDLRPNVWLQATTDDSRDLPLPFDCPGVDKGSRMGMPIMSYAYQPGAAATFHVAVSNGATDIAPLATVRDSLEPDNASVMALNDEAALGESGPIDGITAYGEWTGAAKMDHQLEFTFPKPVSVSAVDIVGAADNYRNYLVNNPSVIVVEADGKVVGRVDRALNLFPTGRGIVRIPFPTVAASVIQVWLPWRPEADGVRPGSTNPYAQSGVRLAEIRVEGAVSPPAGPVTGTVDVSLVDALSGASTAVGSKEITLPPLDRQVVDFKATIPQADKARFLQLKATFTPTRASAEAASIAPILVIDPKAPLKPMTTFNPPGAPNMGFIVTRGFRNVLDTGTGTQETPPGWGLPDDLVWAYEHQMKQVGSRSHTLANKLYVTENDMRHYSTPWRDMPDGEYFYDIAAPLLVERMQKVAGWKTSDTAILGHSDRWDTGPSNGALYGWQDYESFNDYLLAHGKPGLTGKTREELAQEIQDRHESDWMQWGLDRYVHAIRELREDFAAAGKKLVITAQGLPLLPRPAEVEISKTIVGMSDDCTWGMTNESVSLTTGRQMGELAFNPDWRMSTLNQWGYNSGLLENAHWHTPVGTTEPSRRNIYDRAFRGVIRSDGAYTSMHVFGYNNNAGLSYLMTDNDWQEWDREMQRHSLLTRPSGPAW